MGTATARNDYILTFSSFNYENLTVGYSVALLEEEVTEVEYCCLWKKGNTFLISFYIHILVKNNY